MVLFGFVPPSATRPQLPDNLIIHRAFITAAMLRMHMI